VDARGLAEVGHLFHPADKVLVAGWGCLGGSLGEGGELCGHGVGTPSEFSLRRCRGTVNLTDGNGAITEQTVLSRCEPELRWSQAEYGVKDENDEHKGTRRSTEEGKNGQQRRRKEREG
jgi:hypothetical protein